MTDDEILRLVDTECPSREYVRIMTNQDLIDFAEAVVHRTLTNQKARWYQEGVETERRACAKIVDAEIRARGEWTPDDTAYRPDGLSQDELPPVKSYCGGKPNYCEPEMPVDRGAWDNVPDATKWVDELRGDEPVDDVNTSE